MFHVLRSLCCMVSRESFPKVRPSWTWALHLGAPCALHSVLFRHLFQPPSTPSNSKWSVSSRLEPRELTSTPSSSFAPPPGQERGKAFAWSGFSMAVGCMTTAVITTSISQVRTTRELMGCVGQVSRCVDPQGDPVRVFR